MLTQNFRDAKKLGITEKQRQALILTLGYLERGELKYVDVGFNMFTLNNPATFCGLFNMNHWSTSFVCGTVACIGGTAEMLGNVHFSLEFLPEALEELFYPGPEYNYNAIQPAHAAQALRNFLTIGRPEWETVLDD